MAVPANTSKQTGLACLGTDAAFLCLVMVTIQILDGILTCLGVSLYGGHVEGNVIVRAVMEQFGPVTAVVLVKTFGCLVVGVLYVLSFRTKLVVRGLKVVAALYMAVAIGPWLAVLAPRLMLIWLH